MMRPQRKLLWAALGVLVLSNAVALGGVAWNRSAQDCALELGGRELATAWQGEWSEEDSGLRLKLQWRVPLPPLAAGLQYPGSRNYGPPLWLDGAKMRALGFPASALEPASSGERWRDPRREARDVLLVLELAGPAWQQAQRQVQAHAQELAALDADGKGKLQADEELAQEAQASRLFAVDAGLDREVLRQRWPDRKRHAIVQARVAPYPRDRAGRDSGGVIQAIPADSLAVPHALRSAVSAMTKATPGAAPPWTATVAFGRRLEPWLVSVRPAGSPPAGSPPAGNP